MEAVPDPPARRGQACTSLAIQGVRGPLETPAATRARARACRSPQEGGGLRPGAAAAMEIPSAQGRCLGPRGRP